MEWEDCICDADLLPQSVDALSVNRTERTREKKERRKRREKREREEGGKRKEITASRGRN